MDSNIYAMVQAEIEPEVGNRFSPEDWAEKMLKGIVALADRAAGIKLHTAADMGNEK